MISPTPWAQGCVMKSLSEPAGRLTLREVKGQGAAQPDCPHSETTDAWRLTNTPVSTAENTLCVGIIIRYPHTFDTEIHPTIGLLRFSNVYS